MRLLRNILLAGLLLCGWVAVSTALLERAARIPASEYDMLPEGNILPDSLTQKGEGLRKAVIEGTNNIESGIQSHSAGNAVSYTGKRSVGSSSGRVPVAAVGFAKNPQGKVPLVIRTFYKISFAAHYSRDFYVIGMRHLII